ncbi:MAG: DUF885 domain-containing protein [Planctomycetota bacterium]
MPTNECTTGQPSSPEAFDAFLESDWQAFLDENPLHATEIGDRSRNHRWPDLSSEAFETRLRRAGDALSAAESIAPAVLPPRQQLDLELFRRKYRDTVEGAPFGWRRMPLSAREGIQDASFVADSIAFGETADYEQWIERLRGFPAYMDQTLELMREGIRAGMVHARVVMLRVPRQIERQIVEEPEASPFYQPLLRMPAAVDAAAGPRLRAAAADAIHKEVLPAYRRMLAFFRDEYLPACTEDCGAWQWPRGEEMYAYFARVMTTTAMTPGEIHELGLEEVARIREQMQGVVDRIGHTGSFAEFLEQLRSDPSQYYATGEELQAGYQALCDRIDGELPRLFRKLPRTWYDIQPIPENLAPDTTTAYYRPLSADGKRPGTYFVNLYRPDLRPKYEMEALSLHEAVPGHHLQIGLAAELEGLPSFRRLAPEGEYTGYVEGWALYAESLGHELGCYEDPTSEFGRLTYEMWRAVRLVVDTGIHAFRWPREKAIEYFAGHTAKVRHDIENEVDRYIAWPGQALAYKVGEVEIQRLRQRAERELGGGFDLPELHDVLLRNGAVPLDVLEQQVSDWLTTKNAGG